MNSMQLHGIALYIVTCSNLLFYYQFIHTVYKYFNYRRGKTSFEYVNVRC